MLPDDADSIFDFGEIIRCESRDKGRTLQAEDSITKKPVVLMGKGQRFSPLDTTSGLFSNGSCAS
jgi:hypothetical protein